MTTATINPSYKQSYPPSETTLLQSKVEEALKAINCVKIATITAYDPGEAGVRAPTVSCVIAQLIVTSIAPDGTKTTGPYPELREVPVIFPSGGGCIMTFPISIGDECVVLFNDRQLDNWHINGAGYPPTVGRLHDFADPIAFVGLRSNPNALAPPSTTAAQLRTTDGASFIELGTDGHVTVTNATTVVINTGAVTINAPVTINNNLTVTGTIEADGNIVGNGVNLDTHHHTGVTTGSGNTGGPV